MTNDDFSSQQAATIRRILKELLSEYSREERAYVDQRFVEERAPTRELIRDGFVEERRHLDERLIDERTYFQQFMRHELADLRLVIDRLKQLEDDDAKASLSEVAAVAHRLTKLEKAFAKFAAAHA